MAKRVPNAGEQPEVVRFRVLADERRRCETLTAWRGKRDVSQYLRWLLDQEWSRYERAAGQRAA